MMEDVNSISNHSVYYIVVLVFILAAAFNIFFYTSRKKVKSRRLKNIMSKLNSDVNRRAVPSIKMSVAKLTLLGLLVLTAVSAGLCFYIERLLMLEKDILFFAGAVFVCMTATVFIIRAKINKLTFNPENLSPVVFCSEINQVFSIPMFLTSIYTIILAAAVPLVFIVKINKALYIIIIGLIYILWLVIVTAPKRTDFKSVSKCYRSASAAGVVKYYEGFSKQALKEDLVTKALVSVNKAMAYLYYGEYGKAENEIGRFDWDKQSEALRFNQKTLLAIKNYLTGNHLDGYRFAYEARDELQKAITKYASKNYLTDGQSERLKSELLKTQDIITVIGQVLSGSRDRIIINKLNDRFDEMKNVSLPVSLLTAWALCKAYSALNEKREAAEMRQFIKENAPHCKTLIC